MEIVKGIRPTPWRIIVYGVPGIGKSSLGALAPKPLMIDLEGGLNRIDAEKTPLIRSWPELIEAIKYGVSNDYQTLVFDTLDAIELILTEKIVNDVNNDESTKKKIDCLGDIPYGRGSELLAANWSLFIKATERINAAGKNVIVVAHEQIQKFEDPSSDAYDRYVLKCHKKSAGLLVAAMDAVLFAKQGVILKDREKNFNKEAKKRATGDGTRVLHTVETPSWVAKNRFNLPDEIPMNENLFSLLK